MADFKQQRNCALCNETATLYCPSDSAFLCSNCDVKVHNANFLVARHVRSLICCNCYNLDGRRFSGTGILAPVTHHCLSCSPEKFSGEIESDSDSLSSSSSCVSSTTEPGEEVVSGKRREKVVVGGGQRREKIGGGSMAVVVDKRVEGVLVNWTRRFGVEEKKFNQVVSMAVELVNSCFEKITVLPFRVSLTASFWMALKMCRGNFTCQDLKKVEQISGVPAKLILVTESRLTRVIKSRRLSRENHEEGWAEC